jgi:hypothetical protein
VSRSFSRSTFSSFPFQEARCKAQFCIDGTAGPCLAALSGQPPREPGGSRRKARGVDGESARRATMVSGHFAAYITAFLLMPSFPVDIPITFVQLIPRRRPFCYAALTASNLYPVGARGPVPRSLLQQCEGTGLQGGWDPSRERHIAARGFTDHTSHLGICKGSVRLLSAVLITPSE